VHRKIVRLKQEHEKTTLPDTLVLWQLEIMHNEIDISKDGPARIITLNRPKAINALSPNMILSIREALNEWVADDNVRMVLLRSAGGRGFCSGGDVRWTREAFLAGRYEEAFGFFELEYAMNGLVATYPKPIVALTHGVVMGGGIGLAGHAKFRISTLDARFCMPEAAIGFFCDIGSRSIMAHAPRHLALAFMLGGDSVALSDAIKLGLSDIAIANDQYEAVQRDIIGAARAENVDTALQSLMDACKVDAGPAEFCALVDKHKDCFAGTDPGAILARLNEQSKIFKELSPLVKYIAGRCPTSHWANLIALDDARANSEIGAVLKGDLALAHYLAPRGDFVEGVRSVLVDKDQQPKWDPSGITEVDASKIAAVFANISQGSKPR